jgi:3-hydroxyisobutyrate dehydrogenase-like beta-hydroxyacid dehydrogenase
MTTVVVIAQGEMGAGIAARLVENGARVLTSRAAARRAPTARRTPAWR